MRRRIVITRPDTSPAPVQETRRSRSPTASREAPTPEVPPVPTEYQGGGLKKTFGRRINLLDNSPRIYRPSWQEAPPAYSRVTPPPVRAPTQPPGPDGKVRYLFGETFASNPALVAQIQTNEEARYSITEERLAHDMAARLRELSGKTSLVDGTAGVGGNVLAWAKVFDEVTAIELKPETAGMLVANVKLFGLTNVTVVRGSFLKYMKEGLPDDSLVFLDPPWGGVNYKELTRLSLSLDGIPLEDITNDLLVKGCQVALKVPNNFDLTRFGRDVSVVGIQVYEYKSFKLLWVSRDE